MTPVWTTCVSTLLITRVSVSSPGLWFVCSLTCVCAAGFYLGETLRLSASLNRSPFCSLAWNLLIPRQLYSNSSKYPAWQAEAIHLFYFSLTPLRLFLSQLLRMSKMLVDVSTSNIPYAAANKDALTFALWLVSTLGPDVSIGVTNVEPSVRLPSYGFLPCLVTSSPLRLPLWMDIW